MTRTKGSDERGQVAGALAELKGNQLVYFLRRALPASERAKLVASGNGADAEQRLAAGDSGLILAWTDLGAAVAAQVAHGGMIEPLTLDEAVQRACEQGMPFLLRTPDGDLEFYPTTRNRSHLH